MKEPSFLRKLRNQQVEGDSHRHERPLVRPKRDRDGDGDDGPTYVDEESNNILSKAEYAALLGNVEEGGSEVAPQITGNAEHLHSEKSKAAGREGGDIGINKEIIAGIGERKKRKTGKTVGVDQNDDSEEADKPQAGRAKSKNRPKKVKKVKLSFEGGDEGG